MGVTNSTNSEDRKVPVMVHVSELRKVLMVCTFSLIAFSTVAYFFFDQILAIFQKPLGKTLYYTSPTAGFTFAIKLCITVGLIFSVPVLVNRIFSFIKPAVHTRLHRSFAWYSMWSVVLAITGVVFAYFISLPGALDFLTSFKQGKIEALITVDSYFTFFTAYLLGYAVLFQTPIIMLGINRVKPLEPGSTMRYQRHVILGSFAVAAILTPTPDPWNQTLMAIPMILLYQVGIVLVWIANRKLRAHHAQNTHQPLVANLGSVSGIESPPIKTTESLPQPLLANAVQDTTPRPSVRLRQDFIPTTKYFDIIA